MNDTFVFEADTSASVTQFVLFLRRSKACRAAIGFVRKPAALRSGSGGP